MIHDDGCHARYKVYQKSQHAEQNGRDGACVRELKGAVEGRNVGGTKAWEPGGRCGTVGRFSEAMSGRDLYSYFISKSCVIIIVIIIIIIVG